MTLRQLIDSLNQFESAHPGHEALEHQVVMRVLDSEDELHVGGLTSVSIDTGCTDEFAAVLDGDQSCLIFSPDWPVWV